jgi:hypothetical protein
MGRSTVVACGCGGEMMVQRMGMTFIERFEDGRPYKLWACDLCKCKLCGSEAVALANQSFAGQHQDDFKKILQAARDHNLIVGRLDDPPADQLEEPCPECGKPLLAQPRGGVKCSDVTCGYWFCY